MTAIRLVADLIAASCSAIESLLLLLVADLKSELKSRGIGFRPALLER
jgi:hypothetical protein